MDEPLRIGHAAFSFNYLRICNMLYESNLFPCIEIARLLVSRKSDLQTVPYNRPVGVGLFAKNAKNRIQCRRSLDL